MQNQDLQKVRKAPDSLDDIKLQIIIQTLYVAFLFYIHNTEYNDVRLYSNFWISDLEWIICQ